MPLPPIYKIHPAIGIARLGDATTFFIGPETPGLRPTGDPPGVKVPHYKDGGKIKPQAARFHIFEYVDKAGDYVASREVSLADKDVTRLVWTVHLANRKASFFKFKGLEGTERFSSLGRRNAPLSSLDPHKLEIDPKERSISGKNAKQVEFSKGTSANPAREFWPDPAPSPEITTLGRLRTDSEGRLLVLGGSGKAVKLSTASNIGDYANNDKWFDDVSDGPVTAELQLKGQAVAVEPAWVICAPPDFAPHLTNIVTLYDSIYDIVARDPTIVIPMNEAVYKTGALKSLADIKKEFATAGGPVLSTYLPDFATEIYPILFRAFSVTFVFPSGGHHSAFISSKELASKDPKHMTERKRVFDRLRQPNAAATANWPDMPRLLGDEPYKLGLPPTVVHRRSRLTLTHTQYAILKQWANGNFVASPAPASGPTKPAISPEGLDRAALENCVGGAYFPGIEVGWQIRFSSIYAEPFRIKHGAASPYLGDVASVVGAGYFSRQMAVPWQADFLQCKSEEDHTDVFPGFGLWGWWPAQRPDDVFASVGNFKLKTPKRSLWHRATKGGKTVAWPSGDPDMPSYDEMLANWTKFGFIIEKEKNIFVEDDREGNIP